MVPAGCIADVVRATAVCLRAADELGIPSVVPWFWLVIAFFAGVLFAPFFEVLFLWRLSLSQWVVERWNRLRVSFRLSKPQGSASDS